VGALARSEVGDYLNRHFVSSFQKVGTFRIVGNQKQGGNVAGYFCTPNGNVLSAIAGPVDAATLLREANWVVETRKMALLESHGGANRFRQVFRQGHAERLPQQAATTMMQWSRQSMVAPSPMALTALLDSNTATWGLDQQGQIHLLLARYPLIPLDQIYKVVFERILGEKVSTRPVEESGGS
jgi:hypothetical protein